MTLSKSVMIYELDDVTSRHAFYRHVVNDDTGDVTFIDITREKYSDFGKPTKLTVTLEPGDNLNE